MRQLICIAALLCGVNSSVASGEQFDVVVYGGTSAGCAAAVQARRMGKSAVVIEPSAHLGGLTSGGLGWTDSGNKAVIGGVAREYYQRVKKYYDNPAAWRFGRREDYDRYRADDDAMWTFEPKVAEQLFRELLAEHGVTVVMGERLNRQSGVVCDGQAIRSIAMESGTVFSGRMFLDATYEGDLLAAAGVSYTVGRESNAQYGETLNGVQKAQNLHNHLFLKDVDPYVRPGDPSSGLLPGVSGDDPGPDGSADNKVQAYCYRMCMSNVPQNRVPFPKPADYHELRYELLLRNFEAGDLRFPMKPDMMPNGKTDTNNNCAFSTDNIGMNYDYPEASYQRREEILREHVSYQQGFMWTLANHPRVPKVIRDEMAKWGLAADEFVDNGHWPHQIYVREARRLVSDYVTTELDCRALRQCNDSVGMGSYNMDSHNIQRYVTPQGKAQNEGDVQVSPGGAYMISYRSIVPKQGECPNLLVPVCLASSHIAYGSIRMEPVFMILGQSAATAACLAIDARVGLQELPYDRLRQRLLADKQVLEYARPPRPVTALDPAKLPGIVLDDAAMERTGAWLPSSSVGHYVGNHYWHDNHEGLGAKSVRFGFELPRGGAYEVRLAYAANPNRATNARVTIAHAGGRAELRVDQRKMPPIERVFISLGKFEFQARTRYAVEISNADADGHVIADAVQLLPVEPR